MSNDLIRDSWASLGIAFNAKGKLNANPEETIINTIKSHEFPADKKIFSLMILWLEEYHEYIYVERLKNYLKDLSAYELALLGAIAKKCFDFGDHRWKIIIHGVKKRLGNKSITFNDGDDELFLKLKGIDETFLEFGIRVIPLKRDDRKKLLSRETIFKNNVWLQNRLLYGPNLRSDFVTIFTLSLAQNAYQAAKLLGCSMNASYRNWKSVEEAFKFGLI
jgi:hypothetical protein